MTKKTEKVDGPIIAQRKRMRTREVVTDFMEELHQLGFRTLVMEDVQMEGHHHCLLTIDEGEVNHDRLEVLVKACNERGHKLSLSEDHITRQSRLAVWVHHG